MTIAKLTEIPRLAINTGCFLGIGAFKKITSIHPSIGAPLNAMAGYLIEQAVHWTKVLPPCLAPPKAYVYPDLKDKKVQEQFIISSDDPRQLAINKCFEGVDMLDFELDHTNPPKGFTRLKRTPIVFMHEALPGVVLKMTGALGCTKYA